MRAIAAATVLAMALIGTPVAHAQSEPLGPARHGQVQCFEPDAANKLCAAMASYTFAPDGTINNASEVLIFPEPVIVMRISSPVTVRAGAVCGPIRQQDIDRAQFTIDGQAAGDENAQTIRGQMAQQLASMINVEVCTTFVPVDGGLRADAVVGGTARPDLVQHVMWVRPADGYHVAPPAAPATAVAPATSH